ncbi:MAG: response regulator, partial [Erythrobacter sp.]|nr:response regulator [Erythrobacter sp.]
MNVQNLIKRNSGPNRRTGIEGKTLAEKLAQGEAAREAAPVAAQHDEMQSRAPAAPMAGADDTDSIVAAAKAMRDRYAGSAAPVATAKTCLIVDDSRVIRKVSSKIALSLGYVPIEAENGEEALARCKKSMPDLVLTDWNMPEMDGITFVAKLRASSVSRAARRRITSP